MAGIKMKKYLPVTMATSLLIGISSLFFAFPGRCLAIEFSPAIVIYMGIIFIFVLVNFILTGYKDPGTYPKRSEPEDDEDELRAPLYITVLVHDVSVRMKWCSTCNFYRPPRVSHCSLCNNCIEKFDHHCPWINNCIGRRNYQYFFWFLILLSLHMINTFAFSLWFVITLNQKGTRTSEISYAFTVAIMVLDGLLFIPVAGLLGFHITLVSRGRTTNEQVTGKFRSGINPFDNGCFQNCLYTFCTSRFPTYIKHTESDYSKYAITPPFKRDKNLNLNDVIIQENGDQHSVQKIYSESKTEVNPTKINGKENYMQDAQHKEQNTFSNVPQVQVIGLSNSGVNNQSLDPNRFRAKVTLLDANTHTACQPTDVISFACTDKQSPSDAKLDVHFRNNMESSLSFEGDLMDDSIKFSSVLEPHDEAYRQELSDNSIADETNILGMKSSCDNINSMHVTRGSWSSLNNRLDASDDDGSRSDLQFPVVSFTDIQLHDKSNDDEGIYDNCMGNLVEPSDRRKIYKPVEKRSSSLKIQPVSQNTRSNAPVYKRGSQNRNRNCNQNSNQQSSPASISLTINPIHGNAMDDFPSGSMTTGNYNTDLAEYRFSNVDSNATTIAAESGYSSTNNMSNKGSDLSRTETFQYKSEDKLDHVEGIESDLDDVMKAVDAEVELLKLTYIDDKGDFEDINFGTNFLSQEQTLTSPGIGEITRASISSNSTENNGILSYVPSNEREETKKSIKGRRRAFSSGHAAKNMNVRMPGLPIYDRLPSVGHVLSMIGKFESSQDQNMLPISTSSKKTNEYEQYESHEGRSENASLLTDKNLH